MSFSFDPNQDRTARLIRNGLSSALMDDIASDCLTAVNRYADSLTGTEPGHLAYVQHRLLAYNRVVQIIRRDKVSEPLLVALVLWDEGLFFEVHEWIEVLWLKAEGPRKKALQALIRAAGAYVHLAQGNRTGAGKMAKKACEGLRIFGGELEAVAMVFPPLCTCLQDLDVPPKLYGLVLL